jgi:hypothetical protein
MVRTTVYICRERHQSHPASEVGNAHRTGQAPHATSLVPLQAQFPVQADKCHGEGKGECGPQLTSLVAATSHLTTPQGHAIPNVQDSALHMVG